MKISTLNQKFASAVTGLCLMLVARPVAQSAGSFSELDLEYRELKLTMEKVLLENKQLRDALAETGETLAEMRKTLAASDGESAIMQRHAMQMKLRMDALGVNTVTGGTAKLEQRLLAAVNDLRVSTSDKKQLSEALVRLVEAASLYARTSTATNPQARLTLETEIRSANAALGVSSGNAVEAPGISPTMNEGAVISIKDDLALVVMNLGTRQGIKVGMPFQIVRNDRLIGRVRVVDVREKIAGAVIQDLSSEKDRIKVGDTLRVDAQQ